MMPVLITDGRQLQIIIFRDHTYPKGLPNVTFEVVDTPTQYVKYEYPSCNTLEKIKDLVEDYIDNLEQETTIEVTYIL